MKLSFFTPTRLFIEKDCVINNASRISEVGTRCLIVTGKNSALKSGALSDVTEALNMQKIPYTVFDGIEQNPTVSSCIEAGNTARGFSADFIIGIGGGSPLDASKAVAVFSANKNLDENGLYSLEWENTPLPVVCVGTTAGTGSEVTPVSVLTSSDGRKKSIRDDRIYPVLSMGDVKYLDTLSDTFTRSCAVDALSHSIESFFSKASCDISQMFALRSCEMLLPLLEKGLSSLDRTDKEALYLSSVYAGYAISVTGTAFPHAMGYFLSEEFSVPHGTACAVFLPHYLCHSEISSPEKAKYFSKKTGYDIDSVIKIVKSTAPCVNVRLSDADIERLYPRWYNNNGLLRSPGTFTPDDANSLLIEIFR